MANSIAGLIGQATKQETTAHLTELLEYGWLGVAVLIGGQLGSRLGTQVLSARTVKRLTATLVLYVAGRLLYMSFA